MLVIQSLALPKFVGSPFYNFSEWWMAMIHALLHYKYILYWNLISITIRYTLKSKVNEITIMIDVDSMLDNNGVLINSIITRQLFHHQFLVWNKHTQNVNTRNKTIWPNLCRSCFNSKVKSKSNTNGTASLKGFGL